MVETTGANKKPKQSAAKQNFIPITVLYFLCCCIAILALYFQARDKLRIAE